MENEIVIDLNNEKGEGLQKLNSILKFHRKNLMNFSDKISEMASGIYDNSDEEKNLISSIMGVVMLELTFDNNTQDEIQTH